MRLITAVWIPAALIGLLLTGCGGGSGVETNAMPAAQMGTPPTASISGTPPTSATVGSQYSFTPAASDSDGGVLQFSIKNAPAWASFNTSTGQLSGSPKSTDTGSTLNILISVADGTATASLPAFSITVVATPATPTPNGTAKVSWVAPTENSNGTALTDLAGYKIYYGTDSTSLNQEQVVQVSNPATLSYVINGLASGTWYFAVSSYSSNGTESSLSAITSKTI